MGDRDIRLNTLWMFVGFGLVGGKNEFFESWDPRVIPNQGVLAIANNSTCANLEEISIVKNPFLAP